MKGHSTILLLLTVALLGLIVGMHVYERVLPADAFFVYEKVESVKPSVSSNEPIIMRSYFVSKVPQRLEYENALYCDFGNGFIHVSRWEAARPNVMANYLENGTEWQYRGERPHWAAECYMEVTIKRSMDYTSPKQQVIKSSKFWVEP